MYILYNTRMSTPEDDKKKSDTKYFTKWERDLILSIAAIIGVTVFAITLKYFFAPKFKAVLPRLQDTPKPLDGAKASSNSPLKKTAK